MKDRYIMKDDKKNALIKELREEVDWWRCNGVSAEDFDKVRDAQRNAMNTFYYTKQKYVDKLPTYEDTKEQFVPGYDPCWIVLNNKDLFDVHTCGWTFNNEDSYYTYATKEHTLIRGGWVVLVPGQYAEDEHDEYYGPFFSTKQAAENHLTPN